MNLIEWVVSTIEKLGGLGVALLLFLENVFPPIPSEVILPLAGVAAGRGNGTFIGMVIWATVGALAGALLLYGLGHMVGAKRVRHFCERAPLLDAEDFDRSARWFEKHGDLGVFLGRFIPGIRALISIPAGTYRMPMWKFLGLSAIGSIIWNSIFIGFGFWLGENWHVIEPWTDLLSNIAYAVIALIIVWFIVQRIRRNRHRTHAEG